MTDIKHSEWFYGVDFWYEFPLHVLYIHHRKFQSPPNAFKHCQFFLHLTFFFYKIGWFLPYMTHINRYIRTIKVSLTAYFLSDHHLFYTIIVIFVVQSNQEQSVLMWVVKLHKSILPGQ